MNGLYVMQNSSSLSLLLFMLPHPSFPMALLRLCFHFPFLHSSRRLHLMAWCVLSLSSSHGMVCSLARLATTLVIKCILALFLADVGRRIELVDGDVDVLSLHSDPSACC